MVAGEDGRPARGSEGSARATEQWGKPGDMVWLPDMWARDKNLVLGDEVGRGNWKVIRVLGRKNEGRLVSTTGPLAAFDGVCYGCFCSW